MTSTLDFLYRDGFRGIVCSRLCYELDQLMPTDSFTICNSDVNNRNNKLWPLIGECKSSTDVTIDHSLQKNEDTWPQLNEGLYCDKDHQWDLYTWLSWFLGAYERYVRRCVHGLVRSQSRSVSHVGKISFRFLFSQIALTSLMCVCSS